MRNCERLGIQASLEIQTAARAVLEENKHLKALLVSRGWSAPVIDDPTTSQDQGHPLKSNAALLQEKLERHTLCNVKSGHGDYPRLPLQILPRPTAASHHPHPSNPKCSPASSSGDSNMCLVSENRHGVNATSSTMKLVRVPSNVTNLSLGEDINLLDTSSCAFAVDVITNMRPEIATNDVKSALECHESLSECRIDNLRLFAAVDHYAE